jgi:hypothetical protein
VSVVRVRVSRVETREGFPQGVVIGRDDRARPVWLLEDVRTCRDLSDRLFSNLNEPVELWRRDDVVRRLV